jgi:hypothetical protein
LPSFLAMAPVKAPFSCPKSSLSKSVFGQCRAVDGHEGTGGPVTVGVQEAGEHLLACAGFAGS